MSFSCGHNLSYDRPDQIHFGGGKPVAARKVARRAGRANISPYVRVRVVYTVKPPRSFDGPAVHARFPYKLKNFIRAKVASIHALVGFTEKDRSPLVSLAVFSITGLCFIALFGVHIDPTLFAAVASLFTCVVANLTFIRKAKGASLFLIKVFGGSCEITSTTEASAGRHITTIHGPHS